MTNATMPHDGNQPRSTLSVQTALKLAWLCWAILLAGPFLLLQVLIWYMAAGDPSRFHANTETWFVAAMAYLVIIVPGLFFWRGHLFKDYWIGRPVAPTKYIFATISVGLALALGGILSLIGCLVTDSFLPNLIPGLLALVLFVLHWPTGRAMVRTTGNNEDPEVYEEPR
jgi:hypothetical protein